MSWSLFPVLERSRWVFLVLERSLDDVVAILWPDLAPGWSSDDVGTHCKGRIFSTWGRLEEC